MSELNRSYSSPSYRHVLWQCAGEEVRHGHDALVGGVVQVGPAQGLDGGHLHEDRHLGVPPPDLAEDLDVLGDVGAAERGHDADVGAAGGADLGTDVEVGAEKRKWKKL